MEDPSSITVAKLLLERDSRDHSPGPPGGDLAGLWGSVRSARLHSLRVANTITGVSQTLGGADAQIETGEVGGEVPGMACQVGGAGQLTESQARLLRVIDRGARTTVMLMLIVDRPLGLVRRDLTALCAAGLICRSRRQRLYWWWR